MKAYRIIKSSVFLILSVLISCSSSTDSLKKELDRTSKELSRLREDHSRLRAWMEETNDQITVMHYKIERHHKALLQRGDLNGLPVIKLQASEKKQEKKEAAVESPEVRIIEHEENTVKDAAYDDEKPDDDDRPVLSLHGNAAGVRKRGVVSSIQKLQHEQGGLHNLGVSEMPSSTDSPGAAQSQPEAEFEKAYQLYTDKKYDAAIKIFEMIQAGTDSTDLSARAAYWSGECLVGKHDYLGAIGEYERLLRKYPDSRKVPSAIYRLGWSHEQIGDVERAKHYYFMVVEKYPHSPAARRAISRLKAGGEEVMRQASL